MTTLAAFSRSDIAATRADAASSVAPGSAATTRTVPGPGVGSAAPAWLCAPTAGIAKSSEPTTTPATRTLGRCCTRPAYEVGPQRLQELGACEIRIMLPDGSRNAQSRGPHP